MRQISLQSGFYHLAKMPVIHSSEEAKQRERALTIWETLCQQGMNREEVSKVMGVSRASLYRWKRRLQLDGWKGLEKRSRRPKRARKPCWSYDLIGRGGLVEMPLPLLGQGEDQGPAGRRRSDGFSVNGGADSH